MTEKELQEFLVANYPKEDEKCDWKEMKNLKTPLMDMKVMMWYRMYRASQTWREGF